MSFSLQYFWIGNYHLNHMTYTTNYVLQLLWYLFVDYLIFISFSQTIGIIWLMVITCTGTGTIYYGTPFGLVEWYEVKQWGDASHSLSVFSCPTVGGDIKVTGSCWWAHLTVISCFMWEYCDDTLISNKKPYYSSPWYVYLCAFECFCVQMYERECCDSGAPLP